MRSFIASAVLALATLFVAAPAVAGERAGEKDTKEKASFPMPAAQFKQKVDTRMANAKKHMEERASKLPADQAKELRAKFDAGAAKVNAEVAKATADGTVTKEEAKAVHTVAREAKGGHHGKHARRGGGKKKGGKK
jgi:hypothetical protein